MLKLNNLHMKKMIVIIFILVTVSCAVTQASPIGPDQRIKVRKSGDVFKVTYQSPADGKVKVTILDEEGQVVFTEKINSQGGFKRPYNFSQLPKGDYTIQIEDVLGACSEKLSYQDIKWITRVAKLKGAKDKYMVTIPDQGKQRASVFVYNQFQELVFTDYINQEGDFVRIYHLKNLEGATIQVVNQSSGEETTFKTE
jgi:hypothetical protein